MHVVDDPQLRSAIDLLRGEWAEQSGGELVTKAITQQELLEGDQADLVVFPPLLLGELCEAQRLRPLRQHVLDKQDLSYADIYPAVRDNLLNYGGQTMALPIGCPTPLLLYDAAKHTGTATPVWSDFSGDLTPIEMTTLDRHVAVAYHFLARALSYTSGGADEATLFDAASFTPRLSDPPFLRAMEEMHGDGATQSSPPAEGQAESLATASDRAIIAWPLRPTSTETTQGAAQLQVRPLPAAAKTYDPLTKEWRTSRQPRRVAMLGASGRLIAVSAGSRNATSSYSLAVWLTSPQNSRQLATASPNVANVRASLARSADDWTGTGDSTLGRQFADAARETYAADRAFVFPRLVGAERYLSALGANVLKVAGGNLAPADGLEQAARDWESLTEEIGRDQQQKAYQRHLGLIAYEPEVR